MMLSQLFPRKRTRQSLKSGRIEAGGSALKPQASRRTGRARPRKRMPLAMRRAGRNSGAGEIRVLSNDGVIEEVIPFGESSRSL
jgi:hypothetical protein